MLNIKLDNEVFLKSDEKNYILICKYKSVTTHRNRKYIIGYYTDLKQALTAYIKFRQLKSDSTSIIELIQLQNQLKEYLNNLFKSDMNNGLTVNNGLH